jgi:peroxiredoxin
MTIHARALLLALLLAGCASTDPLSMARRLHGTKAPAFTLAATDGRVIRLSDYRGRVVLLNFLGSWCEPCRREMPSLVALQDRYRADGFSLLGVAVSEPKGLKGAQDFVARAALNFPVAMGDTAMRKTYAGVKVVPTSFVIDRDGIVVDELVGPQDAAVYEAAIRAALARPAGAEE